MPAFVHERRNSEDGVQYYLDGLECYLDDFAKVRAMIKTFAVPAGFLFIFWAVAALARPLVLVGRTSTLLRGGWCGRCHVGSTATVRD